MTASNHTYIALLRGINVGGNNIVKMVDLKTCLESMGITEVTTYIQSGNVVFQSDEANTEILEKRMEEKLSKRFGFKILVVLVTSKQLEEVIKNAPKGFGSKPDVYKYDVLFLKEPLTALVALKDIVLKEGVDTAYAGKDVLYFSRLTEKLTQSRLSRIVGLPIYQNLTIRNWNTATKLLALIKG